MNIRFARKEDAQGILEAHYSAVHVTAARDYPIETRSAWSAPVSRERIDGYLKHSFPNETTIVADLEGRIAGFGSIVESHSELRAVYVSAEFGRQGVGLALLRELERLAKERGCKELNVDSSLTAESFYLRHGFKTIGRGTHMLNAGVKLAYVKMHKIL